MSKSLFIVIALSCVINLFGIETDRSKELIKRTVLILPFSNQNNVDKYEYLSGTLMDALKANLFSLEQFDFINEDLVRDKINKSGLSNKEVIELKNVRDLALQLKADVAVIGKYIIIDDNIMIQINAVDIFTSDTVASTSVNGKVGIDIFRIIDQVTGDITEKMKLKLKKVDKSYFDEMSKLIQKEYRLRKMEQFPVTRRVGIGLTAGGSALILVGLPVMIYDLGVYYNVVKYYKEEYEKGNLDDNAYKTSLNIFTGLLVLGITTLSIGVIIDAVGIPLIIYKKKDKKVSLNLGLYGNNVVLFFVYKF